MLLSPVTVYIEVHGTQSKEEYSSLETDALRSKDKSILFEDFHRNKPVIVLKDGAQITVNPDTANWQEATERGYYRPEQLFALEDVEEVRMEGFTFVLEEK